MINKIKQYFENPTKKPQVFIVSLSPNEKEQINDLVSPNINSNAKWSEKIYWIYHGISEYPIKCKICNGPIKTGVFTNLFIGYQNKKEYCSIRCRCNDKELTKKMQQTNLERYGCTSNLHIPEVQVKMKAAWVEKYGGENPMCSKEVQEKSKSTNLKNRGVEYPAQCPIVYEKVKQTNIRKYGVDNIFKTDIPKNKFFKKYGVYNPMSCPDIFNKVNTYRRKKETFPSGKEYIYQGYENIAINLLCSLYEEKNIIIGDCKQIPVIEYFNPVKNKLCTYFPDIFIKSANLIIEVKSEYTVKQMIKENLAKHQASLKLGFNHEIWVCSKTKLIEIIQ